MHGLTYRVPIPTCDNLVLRVEEDTKEEVEEACRATLVHEFVKHLPETR